MRTNQLLLVKIAGCDLPVEHKTQLGSLTKLFEIGNCHRIAEGKSSVTLHQFLNLKSTQEFIESAPQHWGIPEDQVIQKRGKGSKSEVFGHLSLMLEAASQLSVHVRHEMYKELVEGRLCHFRDVSGDGYKLLSGLIDAKIPDKLGSQLIMEVAIAIRKKINPPNDIWNQANAKQLEQREQLEDFLCKMLKMGRVKDKDDLLEVIKNYEF